MASSKNLFQEILNKGLRVGFSRIPRGVLSVAAEHPPLQSTFETLSYISKMPNLGQFYDFYSVLMRELKDKTKNILDLIFISSMCNQGNFNQGTMKYILQMIWHLKKHHLINHATQKMSLCLIFIHREY